MPSCLSSFAARCGFAMMCGAMYALAYPPFGWRWMVVPGLVGLIIAVRGQQGTRARAIGFLHGMTAYGFGLSWLYQIFGGVVVVLWCVLAAFSALFAHLQGRAELRGIGGWKLVIFTTLNWCGWEFIRAELFPLKFPWMTAGLAVGPNTLLPWIGVYGISVLVVLLASLIAFQRWRFVVIPAMTLAAAVMGNLPDKEPAPDDPQALKVAGLQYENVPLDVFLNETRKVDPDVKYVAWPEYAVPFDLRAYKRDWNRVQELCRERDLTLTLGTQSRPGNGNQWRNIALTVDPTGVRGEHVKVHTVHFFDDGIPGTTALPVETSHGKIGTPVCFDCDYEGIVRKMTDAGAKAFVVPIMDAVKWTARQHDQHAELFRIRACENGRWLFVCATSGVSQIIDTHGHVHASIPALHQQVIQGTLRLESRLTFYTRFGWLLPWVLLAVAAVGWILVLLPVRRVSPVGV